MTSMIFRRGLAMALVVLGVPRPSPAQTAYTTSVPALDRLQHLLKDTLEANRKDFAGRTGPVKGFGAGSSYPQIWLRDSATLVPLARYHYPREVLASWIEEHLAHQDPDGSLQDWIAKGEVARFTEYAPRAREVYRGEGVVLSADRNTAESDQEASAIDAAGQVFALTGDLAWLRKPVAGRPLLDRLDAALAFVRARRLAGSDGLVTAAFTADWGDVTPVYPDQRVIYRDEHTPVVGSLYASALFVRGARALAEMHRAAGHGSRAAYWEGHAGRVKDAINRRLWQADRGFYRIHVVLARPPQWLPPEEDIFALGGNALASLYGVADDTQAARIVATVEERRRRYGVNGIGAVLLPPYPSGFFKHPIMREPFTYQNGGQWEWWAGRFVLAEFQRGQAVRARAHLRELAEQAVARGGLFEWATREGKGMGSARYAGSAGALGAAVFQGLFGIDLRAAALDLTVRLGPESAQIRAEQPASGTWASYRYRYQEQERRIELRYESNAPGSGLLAILLPESRVPSRVRRDGLDLPLPELRAVGGDRYAVFRTDWKPHVLEIALR